MHKKKKGKMPTNLGSQKLRSSGEKPKRTASLKMSTIVPGLFDDLKQKVLDSNVAFDFEWTNLILDSNPCLKCKL